MYRILMCTFHVHSNVLCGCLISSLQVIKERVRVLEFMKDYDKLRSGRIPATSFRRALDLCGFGLGQAEVAVLERK